MADGLANKSVVAKLGSYCTVAGVLLANKNVPAQFGS